MSVNAVKVAEAVLPTSRGAFRMIAFEADDHSDQILALVMGDILPAEDPILVRIHSQCLTGDVFGSARCDCGPQLETAMARIADAGRGILLYQLQEGRGIGIMAKVMAYELQDQGHDTVEANHHLGFEADHRSYDLCVAALSHLGVSSVRFMSNNPEKIAALTRAGIKVAERIPIEIPPSEISEYYLRTKKEKLGHLLKMV